MINISRHKFSSAEKKDISIGRKIELEHTKSLKTAERIAKQHEIEFPLYYKKGLIPMERKLKNAR